MNVHEKINKVKSGLISSKMEKTGHNKFAGYSYFELADFVQPIVKLINEVGLAVSYDFTDGYATIRAINVEDPKEIVSTSIPMASASLKGAHDIQNMGAVITYMRRYLLMTLFEIVEHDAIDSSAGAEPPKAKAEKPKKKADAEKTFNEIFMELRSFDNDALVAQVVKEFGSGKKLAELTQPEQVKILQRVRFLAVNQDPQGETTP